MRTCPHCGCSDIDEDAGRGDATCTQCGAVLEESIVVSENQFQERSGGTGHTLVGQFVSIERGQAQARAGVGVVSQESREVTFAKGRKLIEEMASQLRINQHCIDTAYNFFRMCVTRNLTRGRVRSHVVAACLYMTCRLENTAHLLLDFSDITQVNMFDLGRTLSFLSRSLRINLPSTDPCLYILRFACLLEFGEKQKEVVNLATRLVQRMKRDWMATGRRPTGLCGAALLLAARAFNFNRTIGDVVRVVHISEAVVRKRLEEFSKTPSSALTIDEFSTIDLEHEEDPPAFRESRKKIREEQMARETELSAQLEKDIIPMEQQLEKALEKKRREKFKYTQYARIVAGEIGDPDVGVAEENLVRNEIIESVYAAADNVPESSTTTDFSKYAPSLHSLGISQDKTDTQKNRSIYSSLPPHDTPDGSLDLTGIDDDEIDTYILTESESAMKERFWMKLNGEHMKELERKRKEREEEEEKGKDSPLKKKRRHLPPRQNVTCSSAVEAMEKIIQEKRLSNKVNYEILKEIEQTASGLEVLERKPNASQVIKSVNELVATLGMDKVSLPDETTNVVISSVPITSDNMTRREKELVRRHKPLTNPGALRNAFKIEPTFSNDSEDAQAIEVGKPIALSRCSRYARATRPNLSVAVKSTTQSLAPELTTKVDRWREFNESTATRTGTDKKSLDGNSISNVSICSEEESELNEEDNSTSNATHQGFRATKVEPLQEEEPDGNMEASSSEQVNLSKPTTTLLRRSRRRPIIRVTAKDNRSFKEGSSNELTVVSESTVTNECPSADSIVHTTSSASQSTEAIADKTPSTELTENEGPKGAALLRRGRRPVVKPKLELVEARRRDGNNTVNARVLGSAEEKEAECSATKEACMSSQTQAEEGRILAAPAKRRFSSPSNCNDSSRLIRPKPRSSLRLSKGSICR